MVDGNSQPSQLRLPAKLGRYMLDERIGEGGMAEVFRARLQGGDGFEKVVCIKRILPHLAQAPDFSAMFRDEAAIAARLQHANIVQIFDYGDVDGSLFIAMEYVDGMSLARLLQTIAGREELLPIAAVLKIGIDVCKGLRHAHVATKDGKPLGIVHRDVTPHNILLSKDGEVKVADFGVARAAGRQTHTQTGVIKGKLAYMAPEQALGQPYDHRLDQFALAIVLWEALTARRMFKGKSEFRILEAVTRAEVKAPSSMRRDVTPMIDAVLMRALDKEPSKRFRDMAAFEDALGECLFDVARSAKALDLAPILARARDPQSTELNVPPSITVKAFAVKGPLSAPPDDDDVFADGATKSDPGAGGRIAAAAATDTNNMRVTHSRSTAPSVPVAPTSESRPWSPLDDTTQRNVDADLGSSQRSGSGFSARSGTVTAPTLALSPERPPLTAARIAILAVGAVVVVAVLVAIGKSVSSSSAPDRQARAQAGKDGACPARYEPLGAGCIPSTSLSPNLDGLASTCGADAVVSTTAGSTPIAVFAHPGAAKKARVVVERANPGVIVLASESKVQWTLDAVPSSPPTRVLVIGDGDLVVTPDGVPIEKVARMPGAASSPNAISLVPLTELVERTLGASPTSFISCAGDEMLLAGSTRSANAPANAPGNASTNASPASMTSSSTAFAVAENGQAARGTCADAPLAIAVAVAAAGAGGAHVGTTASGGTELIVVAADRAASEDGHIKLRDARKSKHALVLAGASALSWDVDVDGGLVAIATAGGGLQSVHAPPSVRVSPLAGAGGSTWMFNDMPALAASAKGALDGDVIAYLGCAGAADITLDDGSLGAGVGGAIACGSAPGCAKPAWLPVTKP